MLKIDFKRGTEPYVYQDALYFSEEEYAKLSASDIEAIQDARYENWLKIVQAMSEAIVEESDG